jgi:hypothetical protein
MHKVGSVFLCRLTRSNIELKICWSKHKQKRTYMLNHFDWTVQSIVLLPAFFSSGIVCSVSFESNKVVSLISAPLGHRHPACNWIMNAQLHMLLFSLHLFLSFKNINRSYKKKQKTKQKNINMWGLPYRSASNH